MMRTALLSRVQPHPRRGFALVVVLVALAVVMAFTGLWARSVLDLRRRQRSLEERSQAVQLAESALRRAAAQLVRNAAYSGETWQVADDELGASYGAVIEIHVTPSASVPGESDLEAVVRLPETNSRVRLTVHGTFNPSAEEPDS
jgi:type II secretory pathway component PulK